jgi:RNA-directed DNA polymerase
LPAIVTDLSRTLQGWLGYFQHSHRATFVALDKWVRMRLRSILRRQGQKGRERGDDHYRWPNAFFAQHELFSLKLARALACQPSRR